MLYSTKIDLNKYQDDIVKCFKDNPLIFDSQYNFDKSLSEKDNILNYVYQFIVQPDCLVYGIFDNDKKYLYGLILFENIRFGENATCAQAHLAISKDIWGKVSYTIYENILNYGQFDTIYCQIPSIAIPVTLLVKRLGFKKTGYIPNSISYTNKEGEEMMYDTIIWARQRRKQAKYRRDEYNKD